MASIRDVAQKAGVGVGTVSRVINGSGYVAEKTREKIENAIHELEYTPNELARNLFKNRTGIIGVLVPDLDHPFFSAFARETEIALYNNDGSQAAALTIYTPQTAEGITFAAEGEAEINVEKYALSF